MTDSQVTTISVTQLAAMRQASAPPLILDCREMGEWRLCRIDGAVHIPMHDIGRRITELDPHRDTVVYCHHGVRSQAVAQLLVRQGFVRVANLAGGIDAWSLLVDPAVPRY